MGSRLAALRRTTGRTPLGVIATAAVIAVFAAGSVAASNGFQVTITSGPEEGSATTLTTVTFTFEANAAATFRCSLDGAALAACTSPVTYRDLALGTHTFLVEARNVSITGAIQTAEARRSWRIAAPPVVDELVLPSPLPPRGDVDRDGVQNRRDACLTTPRPARPVARGCSPVELVARPEILQEPVEGAIAAAQIALRAPGLWGRETSPLLRRLANGENLLEQGLLRLGRGEICQSERSLAKSENALRQARTATAAAVLRLRQSLNRRVTASKGDADRNDIAFQELGYRLWLVDQARLSVRDVRRIARRLCGQVAGSRIFRGRVESVNDAAGLVQLREGPLLALPDTRRRPPVSKGVRIRISGVAFKDGTGIASSGGVLGDGAIPSEDLPLEAKCMFLRIAPFQPFNPPLPLPLGNVVYHNPLAYTVNGQLRLEDVARLGAASGGCPSSPPGPGIPTETYRYSLQLAYKRQGALFWTPFASDLTPNDHPLSFPSSALPAAGGQPTTGTLRATVRVQRCNLALSCSVPTPLSSETMPVKLYERATLASVAYESNLFNLEDWDTTGFRVGTLDHIDISPQVAPLAPTTGFWGFGYSASGSKAVVPVTLEPMQALSQRLFAVYQNDFYDPNDLFALASLGTDKRSGLMWPRIFGTRQGHVFWYSAEPPDVVRDLIQECTGTDSFYRLPWQNGAQRNVGQGNNNPASHTGSQAFAFDFGLGNGETIRAARGGVVAWLQQGQTTNSNPNQPVGPNNQPFSPMGSLQNWGNAVRILHQDGSTGWYFHIQVNGVTVGLGATVERGQPIAKADNTGRSTGPHLHFQVQQSSLNWGQSIPIRFADCYLPQTGDNPTSNNQHPSFP